MRKMPSAAGNSSWFARKSNLAELRFAQAHHQVFEHTVTGVVLPLRMQIDGTAAMGNFSQELRSAGHIIVFRRPRLSAELGQDTQLEIGLGFSLLAEQNRRVICTFYPGRTSLVGEENRAERQMVGVVSRLQR
jgi:hypothetical protein